MRGRLVQRSIIDRLGLVDTAPDFDPRGSDRSFAMGYTSAEDGRERVPIEHLAANAMAPATGFTSTARDLCLYFSAHCLEDQRILSDDAKRRMQHGWWAPRAQEQYGLGLQLMDIGTRRLIGHSGGYPGHTTRTWCDPKDRLVISVLCNASDAAATPLCNGIFRLLEHLSHPDDIPPSHADGVDLRSFTGHFNTLSGAHDIACFGTRLLAIPPTMTTQRRYSASWSPRIRTQPCWCALTTATRVRESGFTSPATRPGRFSRCTRSRG
jgi:D-alanyl-D-alanine carboxypeptidase